MRRILIGVVAASLMLVGIAGPATARGHAGPPAGVVPGDQTIAEIADDAGFNLLLAAVDYIAKTNPDSALVEGLLNDDQYTVFAPTDEAFLDLLAATNLDSFAAIDAALGAGTVEAVVSYHVTDGRRATNSVLPRRGERTISTLLSGATFSVDGGGNITAVGSKATIEPANISASNGVIHVVDAVLLPVDLSL